MRVNICRSDVAILEPKGNVQDPALNHGLCHRFTDKEPGDAFVKEEGDSSEARVASNSGVIYVTLFGQPEFESFQVLGFKVSLLHSNDIIRYDKIS